MNPLTEYGQRLVNDLALRYSLMPESVITMAEAVCNGNGTMAQFYCPELGGGGQWMQGGMTMVGDMFNNQLQSTVSNLCGELSNAMQQGMIFQPPAINRSGTGPNWWPGEWGSPASSGAQNGIRYAIFPHCRRLALEMNGEVSTYDTGDHMISGVSQQQGNGMSLTFSSQYGNVWLENLPILSGFNPFMGPSSAPAASPEPIVNAAPAAPFENVPANSMPAATNDAVSATNTAEVLDAIEKLASLHAAGVLTDQEFSSKKAELLQRL